MISISLMKNEEITRISEIDRTERITRDYVYKDGRLHEVEVDWHAHRWSSSGNGDHSVQSKINEWKPFLDADGMMFGAFHDRMLIGFVILCPHLTAEMAQLAILYVSQDYRGQGVGTELTLKVCKIARESGAKAIYVSSIPTKNTVDFYQHLGFELAEHVNKELYELEPDDIHMIKFF